jgi:hypothetical protein
MMASNAPMREFQRLNGDFRGSSVSGLYFFCCYPQRLCSQLKPVKLLRIADQRRVAFRAHSSNDLAHGLVHILRHFPLRRQEGGECAFKALVALVKLYWHLRSNPVLRPCLRRPAAAKIGKLRFQALGLKQHGDAIGKQKLQFSRRRIVGKKPQGKQREHGFGL